MTSSGAAIKAFHHVVVNHGLHSAIPTASRHREASLGDQLIGTWSSSELEGQPLSGTMQTPTPQLKRESVPWTFQKPANTLRVNPGQRPASAAAAHGYIGRRRLQARLGGAHK